MDLLALPDRARPRSAAVRRALTLGVITAGVGVAGAGAASASPFDFDVLGVDGGVELGSSDAPTIVPVVQLTSAATSEPADVLPAVFLPELAPETVQGSGRHEQPSLLPDGYLDMWLAGLPFADGAGRVMEDGGTPLPEQVPLAQVIGVDQDPLIAPTTPAPLLLPKPVSSSDGVSSASVIDDLLTTNTTQGGLDSITSLADPVSSGGLTGDVGGVLTDDGQMVPAPVLDGMTGVDALVALQSPEDGDELDVPSIQFPVGMGDWITEDPNTGSTAGNIVSSGRPGGLDGSPNDDPNDDPNHGSTSFTFGHEWGSWSPSSVGRQQAPDVRLQGSVFRPSAQGGTAPLVDIDQSGQLTLTAAPESDDGVPVVSSSPTGTWGDAAADQWRIRPGGGVLPIGVRAGSLGAVPDVRTARFEGVSPPPDVFRDLSAPMDPRPTTAEDGGDGPGPSTPPQTSRQLRKGPTDSEPVSPLTSGAVYTGLSLISDWHIYKGQVEAQQARTGQLPNGAEARRRAWQALPGDGLRTFGMFGVGPATTPCGVDAPGQQQVSGNEVCNAAAGAAAGTTAAIFSQHLTQGVNPVVNGMISKSRVTGIERYVRTTGSLPQADSPLYRIPNNRFDAPVTNGTFAGVNFAYQGLNLAGKYGLERAGLEDNYWARMLNNGVSAAGGIFGPISLAEGKPIWAAAKGPFLQSVVTDLIVNPPPGVDFGVVGDAVREACTDQDPVRNVLEQFVCNAGENPNGEPPLVGPGTGGALAAEPTPVPVTPAPIVPTSPATRTEPGDGGSRQFVLTYGEAAESGAQLEGVQEVTTPDPADTVAAPTTATAPTSGHQAVPARQPVQQPGWEQQLVDRVGEFVAGPVSIARRPDGRFDVAWLNGERGTYTGGGTLVPGSGNGSATVPVWILQSAGPSVGDVLTGLGWAAEVVTLPVKAGVEFFGGGVLRGLAGSH